MFNLINNKDIKKLINKIEQLENKIEYLENRLNKLENHNLKAISNHLDELHKNILIIKSSVLSSNTSTIEILKDNIILLLKEHNSLTSKEIIEKLSHITKSKMYIYNALNELLNNDIITKYKLKNKVYYKLKN